MPKLPGVAAVVNSLVVVNTERKDEYRTVDNAEETNRLKMDVVILL